MECVTQDKEADKIKEREKGKKTRVQVKNGHSSLVVTTLPRGVPNGQAPSRRRFECEGGMLGTVNGCVIIQRPPTLNTLALSATAASAKQARCFECDSHSPVP